MNRLFRTKELPPLVPSTATKAQQDLTARVTDDRLALAEMIRRRASAPHSIAVLLTTDEARRVITELERL
jgi:hypothetical protein